MKTSEKIKILGVKLGISVSEIARRCGKSPQAFNQKLNRERFTPEELEEVAEKLGCRYEHHFVLNNGDKI